MRMDAATFTNSCSAASAPLFFAFDLLQHDGRDLRQLPLIERKIRLMCIMPKEANANLRAFLTFAVCSVH